MDVNKSIIKGLEEAIAFEKGELKDVKVDYVMIEELPCYKSEQIKLIRKTLKLTQKTFSNVLGVNVKTVEAWEAGRNVPRGPAQRMLGLLYKDNTLLEKYNILNYS